MKQGSMRFKKMSKMSFFEKNQSLIFYIVLLIVPVVQFCIFYIGININSILLAFKEYDTLDGSYSWVGFKNFKQIFYNFGLDDTIWSALKNSILIYFLSLLLSTIPATIFSYYMYKKRLGSTLFRIVLFLPSILPSIILIVMYKQFVDVALPGYIQEFFGKEMIGFYANPETQFQSIIFFNMWMGFGSSILLYTGAMSKIDPSVTEAAQLDGVTPLQEYLHIVLPSIYGTLSTFIIAGVAELFINQANLFSFNGVDTVTKNYTIGYMLFIKINSPDSSLADYPYASAMGVLCTLIAVPITYLVKLGLDKLGPKEE